MTLLFCSEQLQDRSLYEISDAAVSLDALERYGKTKCHFVDCVIAATAAAEDTPVATFDEDFRKFPDVRVKTD